MKELLLLLANYPYKSSNKEALTRLITGVTDWDFFVKLVNAHGIIALSAYNIKEAKLENLVPAKAMARLENGEMQSVVRNAWLTERWKDMNSILLANGIKHILLKGMALEHTIYGARGLRQMTDNDILIRKEEAIDAWLLLQKNGFELMPPKSSLHLKIITEYGQHLPALYKDGYTVEIHTVLFDEASENEELYKRMFSESVEISIGGEKAYILPANIHLKYLIRHHTRHRLAGECQMRTYNDIMHLDAGNKLEFPDEFVSEPSQSHKKQYRRQHYKATVHAIPVKHRLRFIAGDVFPSLSWMRRRYKCGLFAALIRYPLRLGKLVWLI